MDLKITASFINEIGQCGLQVVETMILEQALLGLKELRYTAKAGENVDELIRALRQNGFVVRDGGMTYLAGYEYKRLFIEW